MTYIDSRTGAPVDPATEPFALLAGLLFAIANSRRVGMAWMDANGEATLRAFCRHIRVRAFREHRAISLRLRITLNRLDPPACHCGRPATRIVGARTYCTHCVSLAQSRLTWRRRIAEAGGAARDQARTAADTATLSRAAIRRVKRR